MKRMFTSSLITLFLLITITNVSAQSDSSYWDIGYSFSKFQYGSVAYNKGWFRMEGRVFTNSDFRYHPDIGLLGLAHFYSTSDVRLYTGLGLYFDLYFAEPFVTVPLGGVVHPLENKNFGIQLEVAPVVGFGSFDGMTGSIGLRYRLGGKSTPSSSKVIAEKKLATYDRGFYLTLADKGIGPGLMYSVYAGNIDYHVGAGFWPLAVPYGGVYYHFRKRKPTKRMHPYAGLDVGYAFTYSEGPVAYLPVGVQTVYGNGFTWMLEGSVIYIEDFFYPWFGIKLGKSFLSQS